MSAPGRLLTASLDSFLVGFGVYFGYAWTRSLDESGGAHDSRSVFVVYVVGLGVCYCVYALSRTVSTCQRSHEAFDKPGRAYSGLPCTAGGKCGDVSLDAARWPSAANISRSRGVEERAAGSVKGTSEASFAKQERPTSQSKYEELVEALREASVSREKSALADGRLARLFEDLGQSKGLP